MRRRSLPRIRALGLRALFSLLLVPAAAAAQSPALSVIPGRETEATTAPGSIFTAPFQIVSASPDPIRVVPEIGLPPGWKSMTGGRTVAVARGANSLWLVSIGVPGAAAAGRHLIPIRLRREGGGETLYEDTLRLEVAEKPRVQIRILSSPGYAVAGDTVSLRYLVQNQGNAPAEFRLSTSTEGGLRSAERDSSITLGPGTSSERKVVLRAAGVEQSQTARVRVRVAGVAHAQVGDSISAEVVVVPTTRRTKDLYHHLPARLRMRASDGAQAPVLGELQGGGQLFDGRGPDVSFYLRSLGGTDPLLQERDHYSLNVRDEGYQLQLGDQIFVQGLLGGGGQAAFGAGGSVTRGSATAGGFVARPRDGSLEPGQQSAFASYRFGNGQEVTSRLSSVSDRRGEAGGTLATVGWTGTPIAGTSLSVEYGAGRSVAGNGAGYALDLRGDHRWLTYDVAHRNGDETLPGPFRGIRSTSASIGVMPATGISFGGSAAAYRQSAAPTPDSYGSTGRSVTLHANLYGLAGAEYRDQESTVSLDDAVYRQWEEALRLHTGIRAGPLSLTGAVELGERSNAVTGEPVGYTDYSAHPSLSLGAATLSGFARHVRGRGAVPVSEAGWSLGAHLSGRLTDGLRVSFAASDNAPLMAGQEREQRIEARVEQSLLGQHLLSLRAQSVRGSSHLGDSRTLALEYSIPLKIRTGKANNPGRVVGRVVDGESGAGLSGVVVRLQDQLMVSDRAGYVVFSKVRAGAHPLDVATPGSGGRVAIGDSVVVVGERVAALPFHLRMVHGAHVRGSVRLLAQAAGLEPGEGLTDGGGLENIILQLESATDTVFLVTDPHGNFDAGRIRPGRWSVSYVGGTLPALYTFEQSRVEFMVAAGEDREIRMVVRPKHRDIQMIASGEVLVMEVPAPRTEQVIDAEPAAGVITAVATRLGRVKPAHAAPETATATVVAAAPTVAAPSWTPRPGAAAVALANLLRAESAGHPADRPSDLVLAAATRRLGLSAAPPYRSLPAETPNDDAALLGIRREGEDDPPDRPPPREGRIPWDPPPRDDRVPWDPPPDVGRSPPRRWMLQQDPPPTRAGPG